ncbi:MAG: hypothetical protein JW902_03235, partial [Syntrophaceae bacterium]|nr:hypothetical protein [Syntrophaceae bacterium]
MKIALFSPIVLSIILLVLFIRQPVRSSDPVYTTLEDWIRQEAVAFSIDSSESFNASIDKVI